MTSALEIFLDKMRELDAARWGGVPRRGFSAARRFLRNGDASDPARPGLVVSTGLLEFLASRMPDPPPAPPKSMPELDRAALDARRCKVRLTALRKARRLIVSVAIRSYREVPFEMRRCGALLDALDGLFISPAEQAYDDAVQHLALLGGTQ